MPTSRSRAAVDAWVTSAAPDLNTGQGNRLRIQGGTTVKYGFEHPKIPAPRGATVLVAELRFTTPGSSGATYTVTAQRADAKWVESQIDYTNMPGVTGATASVSVTETTADTEWAINVQPQVQTICNGAAYYGFRLSTTDTTERKIYSFNAVEHQPYLYVEWADAPDAPTELSPSGGAAVSVSKPTFLFNFHDPVGSDMAALQLQIKATNSGWTAAAGFASPDFDTGTYSTTDPEYDSTVGSFGGITAGTSKFWTVRVQNSAGVWSDYSDPRQFTRIAKGTLTLSSPTGGTVDDHTPTVIWSLTGATQTGRQITVWDDSDPGMPIYDTGRKSITGTSFTLPKGVITDESTVYRLRVRTWDDLTRTATPGDPVHTEVVTTFSFVQGAPAAPSSATVAGQANGKPHAVLTWVRSSAPDWFIPVRNGKILDELDPVDVLVSGTTYSWVDRTAAPNVSYTYKVRAKVAGHTGPAATATPNPFSYKVRQLWLADWDNPGSNKLIPVDFALGNCSFDMQETSGAYQPVDGDHVINVVQGLTGLGGTILGTINPQPALPAADSVGDMLWAKTHPTNEWRMTLGSQNLRVRLRNILIQPTLHTDSDARGVSFRFDSLDGPSQ